MALNFNRMRDYLRGFDFQGLFVEELGWSRPSNQQAISFSIRDGQFSRRQVAQLAGVVVFEVTSQDGRIPDAKTRAMVHREIARQHHENVLIFVDQAHTQSLWSWVKRQDGKLLPREHLYVQGQPGDLFVSKLGQMVFDISEFDEEGNVRLIDVARRVRAALDIERVTKRFYGDFQDQHLAFLELIQGVPDERQRRWYASVLLNRLMFIYFLQKKGFLDGGDLNYLQNKLAWSRQLASDRFFSGFLKLLFFEGFAKPVDRRSHEAKQVLGSIKYLNGGLFLPHMVERENPSLEVPDKAFENLFNLIDRYSWNLDDTPGGKDDEINPDVLGYIFEKYINQKEFGAYYTRTEITEYLCERTIHQLILAAVNTPASSMIHLLPGVQVWQFDTLADLLMDLDAPLCKLLLYKVLPSLSLLDPACGSGAFLVAAMKTLINVYAGVVGKIKFLGDRSLSEWLSKTERQHPSINYFIKKSIITDNLYGVDLMEEAIEIAKLRLFLALVAAAEHTDQLEPLPNIDFNILSGNSLIGLMRVDDEEFDRRNSQENLFRQNYRQVLEEKNRLIDTYRHAATYAEDLTALRDSIDAKKQQAVETLDDILLDEFKHLGIKFEQATWDDKKNDLGKASKRPLKPENIERLRPFHWGFEFDEILNKRGGFDAIITNPPWEILKPNSKEFFKDYSDLVTKKKMTVQEFEKHEAELLQDNDIRMAWLEYLSGYPHIIAYFREASQYCNQTSIVHGKKSGSDINLYKLFTEQCFNLLRIGGQCGIVIPSGIYTDPGAKQLREMLFDQAQVTGLFGLENRKGIFEEVDSRFKFVVLTFKKGGNTASFPATFMRQDISELDRFPVHGAIDLPVELIRRFSPDSLSVPEIRTPEDLEIASKLATFPMLSDPVSGWGLEIYGEELHMNRGSAFFQMQRTSFPLYEGGMIWQFDHRHAEPRYWIDEARLREDFLKKRVKRIPHLHNVPKDMKNDYETYRIAIRKIASSTNERTLITTIIPKNVFTGNSLAVNFPFHHEKDHYNKLRISNAELLVLIAILNSFVADYILRSRMTTNLNTFFLYQLPVARPSRQESVFLQLQHRSAKLVCTAPEFDDLASEVGLKSHCWGVTDATGRSELRAELDGLVAHLYGLTEEEFTHILSTFPLVPDPIKVAAQNAYRDVERGLIK